MAPALDLTGQRFGRLAVVSRSKQTKWRARRWNCICDCGATVAAVAGELRRGSTRSCGCLTSELLRAKIKHGHTRVGMKHSPEYQTWHSMIRRAHTGGCGAKDRTRYFDRGIRVCERWLEFATFLADMGPRPSLGHSIDRINNDGDYEPGNCRWATSKEQQSNRSDARRITAFGRTLNLTDWANESGISIQAISWRLKKGWPVERAITAATRGAK